MEIFKKVFSIFLRIIITAALLIYLFAQVDKKAMFEIISRSNKWLLLASFCVYFLIYVACLLRWGQLLGAVKIRLPLKRITISYAGSVFFNLFLPSTIGGDLMRSIDLASHTKRTKEVIATVLLDRLSGYIGLVLLSLFSLLLGWRLIQDKSVLISVVIITSVLIGVLLVLFNSFLYSRISKLLDSPNAGRIRQLIKDLHDEIHLFKNNKTVIVKSLLISVFIQSLPPLSFYLIALSLGIKINIIYFFIFIPIIGAITLLPISIGGLGLRDATTIYFFAKVGVVKNLAFAMSLLNFFFILICGAIGGIIYVLTVHHRRIQHHPSSPVHPS